MKWLGALAAIALLLLTGCGASGPSAEEKQEAKQHREQAEKKKAKVLAAARGDECEQQLGNFLEALEELSGRLEIGLTYTEYNQELGAIQVAYNRIPIDELSPSCLGRVGVPSEDAFQELAAAGEAWDECIESLSCEDSVSPGVQAEWSKASEKLERATDIGMTEVAAVRPADMIAAEKSFAKEASDEGSSGGELPEGRNQLP